MLTKRGNSRIEKHLVFNLPTTTHFLIVSVEKKMVRLCCAAVGMGDVFSVEFKINDHVSKLKEAIKAASELENVQWFQLQLYLAKKDNGHGAWLTEEEAADVRYGNVRQEFELLMLRLTDYECFGETFQPGEGQVHVLVLYPTDLHIAMNNYYPRVISSYVEVAGHLKETEEVKDLSSHLANMMLPPFVVLENSSGTGKTQMAFNLQVLGECEVFYIVCGTCGIGAQRVYCAFRGRASAFECCIYTDLKALNSKTVGSGEPIGTVDEIRGNTTLVVYSFILAALRGNDIVIGTASRSDVYAELARRKERGAKPFVFYLDKFPRARRLKSPFDDDEEVDPLKDAKKQLKLENKLRVTRNVILSFGLTVVTSSTNGSGKNLFVTSSHSRSGKPNLWCVMFPSLPRVNITIDSDIPVLLTEIIKHSRPLFAEIALKYEQDRPYNGSSDICSYLNEIAGALASKFRFLKRLSDEFEIAQLNLLLGSSCHVKDDKVDIIDSHFARLLEQSAFELYLNATGLWKDSNPWTCLAVPPSPSKDLLLHLTMTGGAIFPSV
ncbi:hypothetical protein P3T76_002987 [Phytophthora citrophthora]|uniref:Crinkler effector protein N-terminal domain-containing protein n=1 Tax=Phytophthora citrophthora TaxID=4793 RepID=A0AAD9LTB9_9STRA|nr:hypothetical protein P3T76_002987 [Phytophthora citrophthora]